MSGSGITLDELAKKAAAHEAEDQRRFQLIHERLESIPEGVKTILNGSVESTVNRRLASFLAWLGVGGLILLVSIGIAWGSLTTQVSVQSRQLETTLDQKDLVLLNAQISNLAGVVAATQDDVQYLRSLFDGTR